MRVLWVVKGLGPGGAERLLCAAAASHSDGVDIECAYVLPWKDHLVGELESAGVITQCLSQKRTDVRWPGRLLRLVRSGRFDIVHVHSPLPGSVARLAARSMPSSSRPAVVSTEHNRWATHRWPTRILNRVTSRWNGATIAVTDEVRSSISGPAAEQAVTLRHGIDVAKAQVELAHRAAIRAELGIGDDEFVVGTVANYRPQKDYPNLLQVARLLADRDVPVRIVAIGQGPQEAEVRTLHADLDLGERVILTGFRDDAVRVMAACDAFTLASAWEGLPVALMEAMALGLPMVVTDVGGMAEELTDGVDALLVPPRNAPALADAIERVWQNVSLRKDLTAASAERAAEFGVDRTVESVEATYSRVSGLVVGDDARGGAVPVVRPPKLSPSLEIREATLDDRGRILALLQRSLGGDGDQRYPKLFEWKHDLNHFGPSPMWVVTDGDRIAGFRAFMRWEFVRGGEVVRAVRAVDTATDLDSRGQGLFTALTLHGLEAMSADGVDFVYNTPNTQSLPGYLKMGWREVGRLPVAVGFSGPTGVAHALGSRVPAERWSLDLDVGVPALDWLDRGGFDERLSVDSDGRRLRTNADAAYLAWRFGASWLGYRVVEDGECTLIVRARGRGSSKELAVVAEFGEPVAVQRLARSVARAARCSHALRIGRPGLAAGFVALPLGGPLLTVLALSDAGTPPLANWGLTLGDVELF